jgi:hypothetical protein
MKNIPWPKDTILTVKLSPVAVYHLSRLTKALGLTDLDPGPSINTILETCPPQFPEIFPDWED